MYGVMGSLGSSWRLGGRRLVWVWDSARLSSMFLRKMLEEGKTDGGTGRADGGEVAGSEGGGPDGETASS